MYSDEADADHASRDGQGAWEVTRLPAGTSLDGVRTAGFRDSAGAGLDLRVLPQSVVVVVIGLGEDPFTVEAAAGQRSLGSLAAALSPGPARIRGERVECVETCWSPRAAYSLLGVSPAELDGSVLDLEDLWGRQLRQLRERLADTAAWRDRLTLVDGFLALRAEQGPSMTPEVAAVWETIVARRGRVRVDDLAAACGWSRKRLWSRFRAQIGLTPKRAAMLIRFDHAVRALRAGRNAADVALAYGFADQSHLHRDVLAFAGCTPGALADGTATTPR
ncbi:helix-turn-helix domain-containing protein [Streptomyces sp. NPDC048603]|uniref:helix-turn-helix domain-containing protein n=1 Tax=Streptomyces sp. NPDC048603 TaxID=3365577 RepID=UPI00372349ED